MPTISRITLPNGNTYEIKDTWAREQISAITGGSAIVFKGVSSTPLTDGGNENPTVNDAAVTTKTVGDLYFYGNEEFIYGEDSKWHALGDLSTLGALAQKDSATASYQPAGTVSQPTFTGSTMTATGSYTPSGSVSITNSTKTGNVTVGLSEDSNAVATYTPAGSVTVTTKTTTNKTAAVSTASGTATYTPAGSVTVTTSGTTNKTAPVSSTSGTATYTPAGEVSAPTISVKTAGTTASINNPTKATVAKTVVAAAPGAATPSNNITYYSVADETLSFYQLGYTTGDSITTSAVTVKTGDAAYESTAPTFTGTGTRLVTGNIAVPNTYTATFTGTGTRLVTDDIAVPDTYTATFAGTGAALEGEYSYSEATSGTLSGTTATISVTGTTTGSVSQPTFTGTTATITVS